MLKMNVAYQLICYYIAWFSGISLAAHESGLLAVIVVLLVTLAQIIWQYTIIKRTRGLWLMVALFTSLGFMVDSIFQASGFLNFNANPFIAYSPPWMIGIWFNFAVLFYSTMQSIFYRYILVGILSFIFFPIAYILGANLGAVIFVQGYLSSIIIGPIWGILMPICLIIYNHYEAKDG